MRRFTTWGAILLSAGLLTGCQWDLEEEAEESAAADMDLPDNTQLFCATNDDCAEACPELALGCACGTTPEGQICVPACDTPADCPPPPPGAAPLACSEGVCAPQAGGGPTPDGGLMPDGGMMPPMRQDGGMMSGPTPCEQPADCVDACGPEAMGCTCIEGPNGSRCAATCEVDEDCPPGPMGEALICNERRGVCRPDDGMMTMPDGGMRPPREDMGMMPPDGMDAGLPPMGEDAGGPPVPEADAGMQPPGRMACEVEADCEGACDPAAMGCTCDDGPMGMFCVPTCNDDADCPEGAMGQTLTCNQRGICVPEGMMPGGMMP
ncbi:MAG: hypothetical protein ACE366_12715 [Bradymonadia bacterium]